MWSWRGLRASPTTTTPAASVQCRMDETMFLPTPNRAIASGPLKTSPLSAWSSLFLTASYAFFNHPYRSGKVFMARQLWPIAVLVQWPSEHLPSELDATSSWTLAHFLCTLQSEDSGDGV